MKAVATMTPDPKYFAMKNTQLGIPIPWCRRAKIGKTAPSVEPTKITKMADIRSPIRPS